jgi:hypothetical protein
MTLNIFTSIVSPKYTRISKIITIFELIFKKAVKYIVKHIYELISSSYSR